MPDARPVYPSLKDVSARQDHEAAGAGVGASWTKADAVLEQAERAAGESTHAVDVPWKPAVGHAAPLDAFQPDGGIAGLQASELGRLDSGRAGVAAVSGGARRARKPLPATPWLAGEGAGEAGAEEEWQKTPRRLLRRAPSAREKAEREVEAHVEEILKVRGALLKPRVSGASEDSEHAEQEQDGLERVAKSGEERGGALQGIS
eukprot:3937732-Rhodomonas_salina.1